MHCFTLYNRLLHITLNKRFEVDLLRVHFFVCRRRRRVQELVPPLARCDRGETREQVGVLWQRLFGKVGVLACLLGGYAALGVITQQAGEEVVPF